jgi:hypothetical protein
VLANDCYHDGGSMTHKTHEYLSRSMTQRNECVDSARRSST